MQRSRPRRKKKRQQNVVVEHNEKSKPVQMIFAPKPVKKGRECKTDSYEKMMCYLTEEQKGELQKMARAGHEASIPFYGQTC